MMLERIAAKFGASPTQYKHLLQTEKLVEKRALKGKRAFNLSLTMNCLFCFVMSIMVTGMVILPVDVFAYSLIGITMTMVIVALWTIPYFDILLSPINYPVIAHTPVSSRTYFLVKLTKVLVHTVLLIACSNLLPAIGGIFIRGEEVAKFQYFFPFVYLPIVFLSGFFTIGVMTTFAGYLTKLYSKKSLRNVAQYAQFIFPVVFPTLWVVLPHILPRSLPDGIIIEKLNMALKWSYVFPNGWFAGTVSLALGQIKWHFLVLAALAIASTLFLVLIPLRSIARSYSEYLSYLLESGSRQKSELRVKTPLFGRVFQTPAIRAVFCLATVYFYRDKRILRGFLAMLGSIFMFAVFFSQDMLFSPKWLKHSLFIGLSPGFTFVFCFVVMGFIDSFILPIRYSEHWKASWMLKVTPISVTLNLWRGVQASAILYIAAPCAFLLFCIATVLWKFEGILYILPGLVILLNYVILYPRPPSGLPLSEEFVQKPANFAAFVPFLCTILTVGIFVGIQFLTYMINIWAYFISYFVMVGGGLISFIFFFIRKSIKATPNA